MVFWIKDCSTNEANHINNQSCLRWYREGLVSKELVTVCWQFLFSLLYSRQDLWWWKVSQVMIISNWDFIPNSRTSCGLIYRATRDARSDYWSCIFLHFDVYQQFWCDKNVSVLYLGGRWKPWEDEIGIKLYGYCLGKASEIRHSLN